MLVAFRGSRVRIPLTPPTGFRTIPEALFSCLSNGCIGENGGCGLRCRLSGVPCADVESCLDGGAAPVVLLDAVVVVVPGFGFVLYGCRIRSVFPSGVRYEHVRVGRSALHAAGTFGGPSHVFLEPVQLRRASGIISSGGGPHAAGPVFPSPAAGRGASVLLHRRAADGAPACFS